MKKSEFIKAVAEKTGETQVSVKLVLDACSEVVSEELIETGESAVPGIVKFKIKETAACTRRNPKTGDPVEVPAGNKITAKAGSAISIN